MRITEKTFIGDFLRNINNSRSRINRLQTQLSAQKKILTVSDDPNAANLIMRLDQSIGRVEQYAKNILDAQSTLQATSLSLSTMTSVAKGVKDVITGSSNTKDPDMLKQFGEQVDQLLEHGLEVANTNFNRKYIFGGTVTTSAPYTWAGSPPRVVANGNAQKLQIAVGDGLMQPVTIAGQDAFPDGTATLDITFGNRLDLNAALGTTVTLTTPVTDTGGIVHNVVFAFTKTGANRWGVTTTAGAGANAGIAGGSGQVVFNPTTGEPTSDSTLMPLTVTPTGASPASKLIVGLKLGTLTESAAGAPVAATVRSGSTLLFNRMVELRDKMRSGQAPDVNDFAVFADATDYLLRQETQAGFLAANLTNADSYLKVQKEQFLNQRSAVQDVDLAEIGVRLQFEQTMLDAALSTGAKIIPHSLLDFLA